MSGCPCVSRGHAFVDLVRPHCNSRLPVDVKRHRVSSLIISGTSGIYLQPLLWGALTCLARARRETTETDPNIVVFDGLEAPHLRCLLSPREYLRRTALCSFCRYPIEYYAREPVTSCLRLQERYSSRRLGCGRWENMSRLNTYGPMSYDHKFQCKYEQRVQAEYQNSLRELCERTGETSWKFAT